MAKIMMLYLGEAKSATKSDKTPYQLWVHLSDEEAASHVLDYDPLSEGGKLSWYPTKKMHKYISPQVGMIYEAEEVDGKKAINLGSLKYVTQWRDREQAALWSARNVARKQEYAAGDRERAAAKIDPLKEWLDPIRHEMGRLAYPQRVQLLAVIVEYIMRGR